MGKGGQIGIAVVGLFGALAWLLGSGDSAEGTFRYYENVASFVGSAQASQGPPTRALRVHGFVVEGSIASDLRAGHVDFRIRDPERVETDLQVRLFSIDIHDLFKDGAEVVVEGRFEDGRFLAQRVMAKCPSKYEAAPEAEA